MKALVIGLGLAALIGCSAVASEDVGSKSAPGSRDNPISAYTPEDSNPTSTPFPAPSEAIDGICLDWQLDSVNSELAWAGYQAGVRSAPRAATPQEVALCRELGHKTQKEHCEAWYQDGVRPPFIGEAATRATIDRSCREANEKTVSSEADLAALAELATLLPNLETRPTVPQPSHPINTPQPTATPIGMTFDDLAAMWVDQGTQSLEGKRVRVDGILSSPGVGRGRWTGAEYTQFTISISNDNDWGPGAGINSQTGQILRPSRLPHVTCMQRILNFRPGGIWALDEDPPVYPWSAPHKIAVEGTFALRKEALVYINDCRVLELTPVQD